MLPDAEKKKQTHMKAHLQGLTQRPTESKAKMMSIFWLVTQIFLFCYAITAMVDAGKEFNHGSGFMAVWCVRSLSPPFLPFSAGFVSG